MQKAFIREISLKFWVETEKKPDVPSLQHFNCFHSDYHAKLILLSLSTIYDLIQKEALKNSRSIKYYYLDMAFLIKPCPQFRIYQYKLMTLIFIVISFGVSLQVATTSINSAKREKKSFWR